MWIFTYFLHLFNSGLDIKPIVEFLEKIGVPKFMLDPMKKESVGYLAAAFLLYKLVAPARYATIIYVSIKMIRILVRKGLIRPMPSKDKIKSMIQTQVAKSKQRLKRD